MIILMSVPLPRTFLLGYDNYQYPAPARLIQKMVSGNHPAARQAILAFNHDGKTETKELARIKAKVHEFVTALGEICEEKFSDGLSLEVVTSRKGNGSKNVNGSWSKGAAKYFIWLDTIFGLVLKKDDQPIAVLGLDLDYDYEAKVPARFTMSIKQIQGVNAYDINNKIIKRNLKGLNFAEVFMDCCMKLRERLHILRLGIIQSTATDYYGRAFKGTANNREKRQKIAAKLFQRYDQTALDRGFQLNEKSKMYYKYFQK